MGILCTNCMSLKIFHIKGFRGGSVGKTKECVGRGEGGVPYHN